MPGVPAAFGCIYPLLTHHMVGQVFERVLGVAEVYVWLRSQIGRPINAPPAAAHVVLRDGAALPDVRFAIEAIIERELAGLHEFDGRRDEPAVW